MEFLFKKEPIIRGNTNRRQVVLLTFYLFTFRLLRGVDYQNRICGVDDGVVDKPYAAWPWVYPIPLGESASFYTTIYDIKVCIANCSSTSVFKLFPQPGDVVLPYDSKKCNFYLVALN